MLGRRPWDACPPLGTVALHTWDALFHAPQSFQWFTIVFWDAIVSRLGRFVTTQPMSKCSCNDFLKGGRLTHVLVPRLT